MIIAEDAMMTSSRHWHYDVIGQDDLCPTTHKHTYTRWLKIKHSRETTANVCESPKKKQNNVTYKIMRKKTMMIRGLGLRRIMFGGS